jgi:hypothetical protein
VGIRGSDVISLATSEAGHTCGAFVVRQLVIPARVLVVDELGARHHAPTLRGFHPAGV